MDITEYDEFYKWYKANERRFHCSQMTEVQIAYSAYLLPCPKHHRGEAALPPMNDWVCDGLGIMKLKIVPRDNGNKYGDTS